jgi:DNA-binding MltR family transcriptional regulator
VKQDILKFIDYKNILKGKGQIYRFTDYRLHEYIECPIIDKLSKPNLGGKEKNSELEYIEFYRLQEAKM